jgi:predicted nucleotidyltransferase
VSREVETHLATPEAVSVKRAIERWRLDWSRTKGASVAQPELQPDPSRARLAARLAEVPEVRFALVFGSRVTGGARPDSDWDLAIYLADGLEATARAALRDRLVAAIEPRDRVDLVILNDAPPLLAHRALCGEKLFSRDEVAFVRFAVRTLAAAGDEAYWRDLHARERRMRLEQGRFGRP